MSECSDLTYYQRNRGVILNRSNDYYENNKERLREQTRDKYRDLCEEEKKKGREYRKSRCRNMSQEKKKRLKQYLLRGKKKSQHNNNK